MADQALSGAIWSNEAVVESMHGLHAALTEWEKVGAAEEPDLEEMDATEERFLDAWDKLEDIFLNVQMKYFVEKKTNAATLRRLLAREGLVLKSSRGIDVPTQGEWYIANRSCNCVVQYDVDIDAEIAKRRRG